MTFNSYTIPETKLFVLGGLDFIVFKNVWGASKDNFSSGILMLNVFNMSVLEFLKIFAFKGL
jgi:hypothetical protein